MKTNRNIHYFSAEGDGTLLKIIACAIVFHLLIIGICVAIHFVKFEHEPELIPVFEMVQVSMPTKVPEQVPKIPPKTEPKKEPKRSEPKPQKPKINKQLSPEPKVEPKKEIEPEPESEPIKEPVEEQNDFEVDDLDLPTSLEAPSLKPIGSVDMDPLMQVYLERLKQIIMSNFNPPQNINVHREAKTTVQFTVDRFGGITAIMLKRSSGNKTWDNLSVRAVQISKIPELPPNFRAPSLVLHFNFTPN